MHICIYVYMCKDVYMYLYKDVYIYMLAPLRTHSVSGRMHWTIRVAFSPNPLQSDCVLFWEWWKMCFSLSATVLEVEHWHVSQTLSPENTFNTVSPLINTEAITNCMGTQEKGWMVTSGPMISYVVSENWPFFLTQQVVWGRVGPRTSVCSVWARRQ